MKRALSLVIFLLTLTFNSYAINVKNPVDYVNTLVGSASKSELSTGNTYPAIALPWGMNFWTPQTGKMGDGWTYTYGADKIRGLKQTHQPSPWINDYGQFSIMPVVGKKVFDEEGRASWFSHKAETATPYYYKVYLADYDVTAEISPTSRAAAMRITYPQNEEAYFVVDAFDKGSSVTIMPDKRTIIGYTTKNSGGVPANFKNYFILRFDHEFSFIGCIEDSKLSEGKTSTTCNHAMAVVGFRTKRGEQVNVQVASSFISDDQALRNLKEIEGKAFDEVKTEGRKEWNNVLGRIEVENENIDHLRTFYSCLYRSVLFPRSFYELDEQGKPIHYSPYNGQVLPGYLFTDTGFWDTFRSLFPLLNLVYPSMNEKMQAGLINAYKESGFLPEWASPGHRDCMVGNNSASVVADAYIKGLRGYDIETLWKAVVHGANAVHPTVSSTGRKGFDYYNRLGYIPYNVGINESVARTLEYAYDDWCIYQLGLKLGKSAKELQPFKLRAMNYQKVFDKETGLMRGRAMLDSVFQLPPIFDDSYYGFTIHEIREMQIMNMGNYAHGNQPIQHMIYLYDYSGQPWKAQYWVREVMDRLYTAQPDGYCGDEDNGQTSAWYVFSALGFYPVCPGSTQYMIGTPYFSKVKVRLENGKTIILRADKSDTNNRFIQRMTMNGQPYQHHYLEHEELMSGAEIDFTMGDKPVK